MPQPMRQQALGHVLGDISTQNAHSVHLKGIHFKCIPPPPPTHPPPPPPPPPLRDCHVHMHVVATTQAQGYIRVHHPHTCASACCYSGHALVGSNQGSKSTIATVWSPAPLAVLRVPTSIQLSRRIAEKAFYRAVVLCADGRNRRLVRRAGFDCHLKLATLSGLFNELVFFLATVINCVLHTLKDPSPADMASTVLQLQSAIHSLQTNLSPDVPARCSEHIACVSVHANALLQHHAELQQALENKYVSSAAAVGDRHVLNPKFGHCCRGDSNHALHNIMNTAATASLTGLLQRGPCATWLPTRMQRQHAYAGRSSACAATTATTRRKVHQILVSNNMVACRMQVSQMQPAQLCWTLLSAKLCWRQQ